MRRYTVEWQRLEETERQVCHGLDPRTLVARLRSAARNNDGVIVWKVEPEPKYATTDEMIEVLGPPLCLVEQARRFPSNLARARETPFEFTVEDAVMFERRLGIDSRPVDDARSGSMRLVDSAAIWEHADAVEDWACAHRASAAPLLAWALAFLIAGMALGAALYRIAWEVAR